MKVMNNDFAQNAETHSRDLRERSGVINYNFLNRFGY